MNILITGGLGFIGINTALRFANGNKVVLFDNLAKAGSPNNIKHAKKHNCEIVIGDIRNLNDVVKVYDRYTYDVIFHFAAQTAVTHSVTNPLLDFESNAVGSFYLLETMRTKCPGAKLIYACSNKVYGDLTHRPLMESENRYDFQDFIDGIDEDEPLDFYSPYGCSKGAADQYIRDYSRIYGLHTTVVRQSCIYGDYQDGTEDQGWVAWFVKAYLNDIPITIYGNGKQVRDILYIDDLVDFYQSVLATGPAGEVYNIGGGHCNTTSLLELIDTLDSKMTTNAKVSFDVERPGDQKIFISDNTKAEGLLGWSVKIDMDTGLDRLIAYLKGVN